jgi:putative alpha-1,2-mannosidase
MACLRVENDTLITGYRITNGCARGNYTYFALSFSKPIQNYGYTDKEKPVYTCFWKKFSLNTNFPEIAGCRIVCHFEFGHDPSPLIVKTALSAVSTQGSVKNLEKEAAHKSFE